MWIPPIFDIDFDLGFSILHEYGIQHYYSRCTVTFREVLLQEIIQGSKIGEARACCVQDSSCSGRIVCALKDVSFKIKDVDLESSAVFYSSGGDLHLDFLVRVFRGP